MKGIYDDNWDYADTTREIIKTGSEANINTLLIGFVLGGLFALIEFI